jgi:UDP-N-acetylglucosamine 3-dehydrogenase
MTRTPTPIHLVFLGCGRAAAMHARTLRGMAGVAVSFASRRMVRAEALRRRWGGTAFSSYEAALADASVDVAVVTTPTNDHRELALAGLLAGKHVIVEKPAFMRSDDADVVRVEAERAGRRVFVAENYAYKPVAGYLRDRIVSGTLGDLRFVTINATKYQNQHRGDWRADVRLAGGGALFEGGVHWISFVSNLGLEVADIEAHRVGPGRGAQENTLVVLRYATGAVCTLIHAWDLRAPLGGLRLSKVQGSRGAVTFESNGLAAYASGPERGARIFASDPFGYRGMWRDFLDARRRDREPRFTLELAQRDLQLLERAEGAMEAKQLEGVG